MHALKYNHLFTKHRLCEHLPGLLQSADGVWRVDGHQGPQPCTDTLAPALLRGPRMPRPSEVRTGHISLTGVLRKSGIRYVLYCKEFSLIGMKNALNEDELGVREISWEINFNNRSFMHNCALTCMCVYKLCIIALYVHPSDSHLFSNSFYSFFLPISADERYLEKIYIWKICYN